MKISTSIDSRLFPESRGFVRSVSLDKVLGHYQVKTATTEDELKSAFKLRYDVFYREFSSLGDEGEESFLDIEEHDFLCDHLLVKDLRNGQVVACYRLLSSEHKPTEKIYYSESEFVIDGFTSSPSNKLELGRACVHKDYRRGTVILLLWRGLIEYARMCGSRYMFGCSSISHDQFAHVPAILKEIALQDKFITDWNVGVREQYQVDVSKLDVSRSLELKGNTTLMQMYLSAGAKVGNEVAYDRAFDCIDLFTVLDLSELPQAFRKGLRD